ncbi:MAG: hemerythrin domain-containing protein [Bacteroidia bacterium]
MKNPIELLQKEHELMLQAVGTGKEIQKITEEKLYFSLMHDYIIFIRNFTEIYHYPKEEHVLFPMLRNRSEKMNAEFIYEICDNHEDFKSLIAEMETHYENYNYQQLHFTMGKYLHELATHIKRENTTILSVCTNLFSEKELETLYSKFIEIDEKHGDKEQLIKELYKISEQVA